MKKNSLEVIPLIDDFSQWLIESGKSDNTIKTYRAVLNQFHEWLLSEGRRRVEIIRIAASPTARVDFGWRFAGSLPVGKRG